MARHKKDDDELGAFPEDEQPPEGEHGHERVDEIPTDRHLEDFLKGLTVGPARFILDWGARFFDRQRATVPVDRHPPFAGLFPDPFQRGEDPITHPVGWVRHRLDPDKQPTR